MKHLILVDGNSILFRAYYATAYPGATLMQTSKGEYTNALFAFANMFSKIVPNEEAHVLVAFDTGEPTFRHLDYKEYKAGRSALPPELGEQFSRVYEYIEYLGIKAYSKGGFEADDIIGIYAKNASSKGIKVDVYSSDRDLLQLVDDNITVNLLKKGMQEVAVYTPKSLFDEFELTHDQIIDLKALQGDSSDNIPGVPGVGPKTATTLLKTYGTIENLYDHTSELKGKLKENIETNKELAFMSKKLVTIMTEGSLDHKLEDLVRTKVDYEGLTSFLQRFELHSLVKQMEKPKVKEDWNFLLINDEKSLKDILTNNLAIYFEFDNENYHTANLWGIGLSNGVKNYFVNKDLLPTDTFKNYLKDKDINKLTYNFKASKVNLLWKNIEFNNCSYDMLLAAYLIDSHFGKEEFKYVASNFDYDDVEYDEHIYGKGAKKGLPLDESLYQKHIVSKARAIYKLKDELISRLKEDNQLDLMNNIELPLSTVLAKMEFEGIMVSKSELLSQKEVMNLKINELTSKIIEYAGKDFNVASPKQLGEILFEDLALPGGKKNKTGYSTNADVLNKLKDAHPIIELIIEYRELSKLYSTYIQGLENVIFSDSRIHTIYMQALTTTGRLSSVEPNLQNIPTRTEEGRQIRKIFVAKENHYLLGSDYSQIELRVLAHMANVKALKEAFSNNRDIHTETAKAVFEIDSDVTSEQRRAAKAVNFGIIYGIGSWSLADDLNISVKEADQFIKRYLDVYPEIKKYMEDIVMFAEKNGFVETMLNRRRYIPELKSQVFMQREFGKRTALNAPIQGSAADIIKIAMINLDKYLEDNKKETKLLLQVHDELILEVPEHELKEMEIIVPKIMEEAYLTDVKLESSCEIGKTWYEI